MGYLEWHADADRRAEAGEEQRQCEFCKRWIWENEYEVDNALPDS